MNQTMNLVGRGVVAGVAGSGVMAAFQKLIEMPITGREASYQPAKLAKKLLPIQPEDEKDWTRLNYAAHFTLGAMWGAAYGVAASRGHRGAGAVARVFPAIYTNDVVVSTSLGLTKPWKWSRQGLIVDLVDKFVQAAATSFIFDHFLDPTDRNEPTAQRSKFAEQRIPRPDNRTSQFDEEIGSLERRHVSN
ncbi:MAG: hypothetical protein KY464_11515 [Gemmatimonadetes bacterium]|nr:hypothetical protein [Gemmatimonadota bacterium]